MTGRFKIDKANPLVFPRLKRLLMPALAAAAAGLLVPAAFWTDARTGLLASLSVIAAAVMVRLARGLPFTNADHFEVEEIRQVTAAIKQIMRALAALIVVVLGTMGTLTFADRIVLIINSTIRPGGTLGGQLVSAVIAFLLAYVLTRIFQVVMGDLNLVDLQSRFLIRAVERRQREKMDDRQAEIDPGTFKTPEGFGRLVQ
jgi:hypothetical protein